MRMKTSATSLSSSALEFVLLLVNCIYKRVQTQVNLVSTQGRNYCDTNPESLDLIIFSRQLMPVRFRLT